MTNLPQPIEIHVGSEEFERSTRAALANEVLQGVLLRHGESRSARRRSAIEDLPEYEALRDHVQAIKQHTLKHLDHYLEEFEERVVASGGKVHWCVDGADACDAITKICKEAGVSFVTKGKSMVGEEIRLNEHLIANNIIPMETDLGEYLLQLARQPPSHVVGPAMHLSLEEVEALFRKRHMALPDDRAFEGPEELVTEARHVMREHYYAAGAGITGANFLVAETGSTVIVTNEGNGDLTQILPKVHIVLATIEKVVPTLEDCATILRVLARAATGQELTAYTTFSTGAQRPGDLDGPSEFHVILLDGKRSELLGEHTEELLQCIKCGACMNHCPVYLTTGGHSYGWVYPGPLGKALLPQLLGLEDTQHLPAASTFCGKCNEVCPAKIPLTSIMRRWREESFDRGLAPTRHRLGMRLWGCLVARPTLYRLFTRVGSLLLRMGRAAGGIGRAPFAGGWSKTRDLPAPSGATFFSQYAGRSTTKGKRAP